MSTAFHKTVRRTYLKNKGRFLANFLTVMLSVAITSGLSALPSVFTNSYAQNFQTGDVPDLIIKSRMRTGFSPSDITKIESHASVSETQKFFVVDAKEEDGTYNRFYIYDFASMHLAVPSLLGGTMPVTRGEAAFLEPSRKMAKHAVGDTLTFSHNNPFLPASALLTGKVDTPLYNCQSRDRAELEDRNDVQYVSSVFFFDRAAMPRFTQDMYTDLYVKLNVEQSFYTEKYQRAVDTVKKELLEAVGEERIAALTLEENTSYALFKKYNEKITILGTIFPFFFVILCALINHIGATRLIKDERAVIAVYSSMGVPKSKIIFKYTIFVAWAVLIGGLLGYFLGAPLLPFAVYPAYTSVFTMFGCPISFFAPMGIATLLILLILTIGMAAYSASAYLREQPSELTHDKAPVPGKKILLEHFPLLWNRFSFSIKSTFRNIFRQRKNFFLTSFAVILSTLLLLAGISLQNVSAALTDHELYADVASSMGLISAVIVLFALAMAFPTIYSLANMNIVDRSREIATLKVLGYTDRECLGYTFREILIITIMATIIGLPISALLVDLVLRYLEFGSIVDVKWWAYVVTAVLEIGLSALINILLYPRIKSIDMNASLKSIE